VTETIETTIWFETDSGEVLGRELEDKDYIDLTEEVLGKMIDDGGFSIVVRSNPGYRHYVQFTCPRRLFG
jgi:hypothetical protein